MAFDEVLAQRIRVLMQDDKDIEEKKLFGGIGFLARGNMACGVHKDQLMVRVGPEAHEEAMDQPFTSPFDITGRPMKGWLLVQPPGFENDSDLEKWVDRGLAFARSLPAK